MFVFQNSKCLLLGSYLDELWGITQVQRDIFHENLFINAAILFQHKCIISTGDQENLVDSPLHHQVELRISEIVFLMIQQ